ncbi:glycerol-3-phosphate dehydrogenase/oxidase [Niveispirillum sp. KHB5.9]|uniref:glycerol-3-phosphate dehydrogenase/oxidase n=1 Tax=Niveispirillum sp. KHB5.9 TaxID=3400269 RepID=UPI003A89A648
MSTGLDRAGGLARLDEGSEWDIVIIGGGATGLGTALDAAARGYRTLLLEGHDFAKGTSSRATKLVHGGVRYLAQGNIHLVRHALHERGRLLANAPQVTRRQGFVVPCYRWWDLAFYGIGLFAYDLLAGKLGLGRSRLLSRAEVLKRLPTVRDENLRGGILYYDGQFDDSRLAATIAASAADHGATLLNYVRVTGLLKQGDKVAGVTARDMETGTDYRIKAKAVVNAAGIFMDEIRRMDRPDLDTGLSLSQGVHLVLDASFLSGDDAILIPKTADGRVLFVLPWLGRTVVGTTDTPIQTASLEPHALESEIEFLLSHAAHYLKRPPARFDVLSVFTGIRPLVRVKGASGTSAVPRDHVLMVADSGLVTITGGKWTTYREMAEQTVDAAARAGGLAPVPCPTAGLHLHGWKERGGPADPLSAYGADAPLVRAVLAEKPGWDAPMHPNLPYFLGEAAYAVRHLMARTVEDVLSRRTRSLLLDARAAAEAAPAVAAILAAELGRDEAWVAAQVAEFRALAAASVL